MCENCENLFESFYYHDVSPILNEAIDANILIRNTDSKRLKRAYYEVKRTQNIVKEVQGKAKTLSKIEWNNRAEPSSEGRNHAGYIVWDEEDPKKKIYELFCDCADFFFRNWYTFNKVGMTPWKLEPKYEKRNQLRADAIGQDYAHHNREKQKFARTNMAQTKSVCKHLAHIIHFYVIGDLKPEDETKLNRVKTPEKKVVKPEVKAKVQPKPIEKERPEMKKKPEVKPVVKPVAKPIVKPKVEPKVAAKPVKAVVPPKAKVEPKVTTKPTAPVAPQKKLQGKVTEVPVAKGKTPKK